MPLILRQLWESCSQKKKKKADRIFISLGLDALNIHLLFEESRKFNFLYKNRKLVPLSSGWDCGIALLFQSSTFCSILLRKTSKKTGTVFESNTILFSVPHCLEKLQGPVEVDSNSVIMFVHFSLNVMRLIHNSHVTISGVFLNVSFEVHLRGL